MKHAAWILALLAAAPLAAADARFKRGDANRDGLFDISDPVKALGVFFLGEPDPGCNDSLDMNDDGALDVTDGIYALASLFTGGPNPPAPFPNCGTDLTADVFGCADYPGCPPAECFDETDVDQAITENVPKQTCVSEDAAVVVIGNSNVVVCPAVLAAACGPEGEEGCPVELTTVDGTLLLSGKRAVAHVEGKMVDFPIRLEDRLGVNDPIDCTFDVTFTGDVVMSFEVAPGAEGSQVLTRIDDPKVEDVALDIKPDQGGVCVFISLAGDQFIPELAAQLEAAAAALAVELRAVYVGQPLCR